ncbi:hypothetical protein [Pseudanabaena mucicola]|uniref:DUF4230 domain-containing protein n=1 Tax=Pseudanabaena mucicola FACHB-723 TaxID=2692860 RepID=A0ABR8A0A4_9CYAN|nr:hypothetical protein [Pseudanabaena mucicola]MBD2189666.1 hypothetical protein [Pseudanabaena mucicola FACHB-723]
MVSIRALLGLAVGIVLLQSCQPAPVPEKQLEETIITKIRQDTPYLAHLEAIYSVNYVNYIDKKFFGIRFPFTQDDIYIRNDVASVFYGYPLKDADISVIIENNQRTLRVKLPEPRQIAIDRRVRSAEVNDQRSIPLDEQGRRVDVDQHINGQVNAAITKYEEQTVGMTREMTRQYFQAIADRFNLKLQLEFVGNVAKPKEKG